MKRAFWILLTPLAGFLVLWVIGSMLIAPRLETWALEKIRTYSATSLPVNIEAEKLELRFLKPSVALEKIRITGKGTLEPALKNIQIERVRVFVDFFHLLAGGLTLSAVVVESPDVALNIDPFMQDPSPPQELPLDELFSVLEKLPLQRIFLRNLHLQISSQDLKLQGELSGGDLLITNMGKNLTAKANLRSLQLQLDKVGSFQGSLDTHLYLTRQSLRIIQLGVRLAESEVLARGEFTPVSQLFIKPAGLLSVSARVKLDEFYREIQRTRPDLKIPPLAGELNIESEARFQGLQDLKAKAEIQTRSLIVEKIKLGDAKIQGEYSDRTVRLSEMQLSHPAGEASVTKAQITLAQDFAFKTQVTVHKLDLQQLFHSLNLHDIPAGLQAQGQWPCEGHIYPSFQLTCTGASLSAHDIWVKAGMRPRDTEILNVKDMSAQGQVQVTTEAVSYSADVTLGSSKGSSEGVIDFAKGFKIQFKTDRLDIKDITNLAHLKIEGQAGIEGSTSGDSHGAIFDMKLNARDFVFEDYTLGNLITLLKYRQGRLLFEDVAGAIKRTQYIGHLDVNLSQSTVQGEFSLPTAELNDVATAFSRVYKFPLTTQGTGSAKARVQGPLNFWKLNYQLQAAFKNGVIGPESFDTLDFNVSATDGNLKADKVRLQKGQASIVVNGGISSQQIMNLSADGKGWKLEESDLVGRANSNIIGNLSFSAEIKDSTKTPQVQIKGSVTDTLFEEQELPNSNFILQIQRESFSANLSLFGNKVQGEFQVPLGQSKTPLSIKMKTNNWGYSSLLGLIGGSNLANEYTSTLTSTVDLRSETGDPLKSTGKIMIQETSLKRGALQFANKAPIEIVAENGVVTIKDFQLEGPDNNLQIVGSRFTADNLNVAVSMRADLRLLHIFLPFLEDLGGSLNLSATVSGPLKKPEILGNLQSQNAYIKIKGFPHPLERLSTEVVFSQSRILINSVKAQIAGGTVNGDGGILINGIKDLPTSLRLRLEGVTFNVPDKVRTSGQADLLLSGHWFPFTLSGTFHVDNALVEKEFTEEGGVAGVKQSLYLPKLIREGNFEPLILDLQIVMNNNILVRNSLLDGSVNGYLQVKGPPSNPLLFGKINTDRKAKLIFKDKVFEIQNGVIDFNDPNEINPHIYITAQSRIDDYDITLLAQGPAKNVGIRLTSVPPLAERDIISLIALGVTSSTMDQNVQSRQQAEQLGVEIGGAVLAKPISKQLESTLGLNFQVTSQYDSTRNISVPKITLSRRLSERVKVSGSRPVGDSQSYDLKMEYLINNNITAIGSFESRGVEESTTLQNTQPASQSIFGLDLEFKREFK